MCGCTLYDSPTCGHSWLSMSQPCGFLSDLLSCPNRQTYQSLIAPPYTCPQCNSGFADCETIEMVQGPWGCNQLIRSHVGGNHAIPGSWGSVPLGMSVGVHLPLATGRAMVPDGFRFDHRLSGLYGSRPAICGGFGSGGYGGGVVMEDGFVDWDGRRRGQKSSSRYVYRHSSRPATNCAVM